jgi:transcriptional regulator with XRE-family HTH domain
MFMQRYNIAKESRGITFKAIGDALGLSETAIWNILNEKHGTRYKIAVEIGELLGMKKTEIIKAWKELQNLALEREIQEYTKAKAKPLIIGKRATK